MTTEKKTYNLDARLVKDVEAIAQAQATSNTAVIENAIPHSITQGFTWSSKIECCCT